jgi:hypothetical protein
MLMAWVADIGSVGAGHFGWCRAESKEALKTGEVIALWPKGLLLT